MKNFNILEKKLKIKFKNRSLLIDSMTHKSLDQKINNEKLEFLGDRVIGLVLAKELYKLYPNETEGVLDKRFARLVNKKTCCEVAWANGIQNCILYSNLKKKITIKDEKILSDSCEALIGAIFIDQGFDYAKNIVLKMWKKHIEISNVTILDPKTKLQEYSLKKYKKLPIYKLINSKGPKHNPIYTVTVSITGTKRFSGVGYSKQQAELNSAAKLIEEEKIS